MSLLSDRHGAIVDIRHAPWHSPEVFPQFGTDTAPLRYGALFRVTNRKVLQRGRPAIPVTGEMHFSRVPRDRWRRRLQQMKSGGVTAVSSYVIWIHHQPAEDCIDFSGNRDLRGFVTLCEEVGLEVVLRIGPWVHGEVRNGGLPDWVQNSGARVRTNDPGYLRMVTAWFTAIAGEILDLCRTGSSIIAFQIDNELYDQPEHLHALKDLAVLLGLLAPIYTATGWGSAQLPAGELLPVFGGYPDGFWLTADQDWADEFRNHFFFSHRWDDPGIGADLRASSVASVNPNEPQFSGFPPATCELGGGMAAAYHRRPVLQALDIAAVAHNKLGSGSAWQGYYMYAGGQNPRDLGAAQESHATKYPNDLPCWDYDFHAPIGASGSLAESYAHLRRQHSFLRAFGDRLAIMSSSLPDVRPSSVHDSETLRWALRSDGESAFLFVSWHQPYVPLDDHAPVQFRIELDHRTIVLPPEPIEIPVGTLAHWPIGLHVGGIELTWATASPLTILPGDIPTLVLTSEHGIRAHLQFAAGTVLHPDSDDIGVDGAFAAVTEGSGTVRLVARHDDHELSVVVLPFDAGLASWVLDEPKRRLVISASPLWELDDGRVAGEALTVPTVVAYEPTSGTFAPLTIVPTSASTAGMMPVDVRTIADPRPTSTDYGAFDGRASAPDDGHFRNAARFELRTTAGQPDDTLRRELTIEWEGDVARLVADGVAVADRFWDGSVWTVDLDVLGVDPVAPLEVHVLPLVKGAPIRLPEPARDRLDRANGPLCAVQSVTLRTWAGWEEST